MCHFQEGLGGTSGVVTVMVGAKDKDLPGLQSADMFWGYAFIHIGSFYVFQTQRYDYFVQLGADPFFTVLCLSA